MNGNEMTEIRALLVEDQPAEAELVREYLNQDNEVNFRIEHVQKLSRALDMLKQKTFDVVLLDLGLPDSVGYVTFERVNEIISDTPLIVLTNMDDEGLAVQAVREGAQDYLVKRQINATLLQRAVRYAVERAQFERELRLSEERYALAVQGANDGLWDWNLVTDEIYLSPRWKEILGFAENEFEDSVEQWMQRIHPDDRVEFRRRMQSHLQGKSDHFIQECRLFHRDGSVVWAMVRGLAIRDEDGEPKRMAGSLSDVTVRKRAEERLSHDAFHDSLTGLPNRNLFLDRIDLTMRQSRRQQRATGGLLFLDLDRFKNVNDSVGHSMGDKLLVQIAHRLTDLLRPADTIARLGGDEFAILLPDIRSATAASQVAERILEVLGGKFLISGHEIFATASIGIALNTLDYERPEELLRDADIAMYRAKANGKARYELFDREMHNRAVAQLQLETDLRRAIERNEFTLEYQPIVSLKDGRMVGFESLVRWDHPERGQLQPMEFIPTAEETGLIVPICWWTIYEACRQMSQWQKAFPDRPSFTVSVNVSGRLFHQWDMVEQFERIFHETGMDPSLLRIEITESRLLEHVAEATTKLAQLRDKGVGLQIDDFGTGYCSLTYLQKFSYDSLKIDRSFVSSIEEGNGSGAIVQTIIALGHMLNMNIIAEGVETEDQLQQLRNLDCPQVQGFWFSKPVDHRRATELIDTAQSWAAGFA